jgi:hypothetical protein
MGMKSNDEHATPLCSGCHRQQHAEGEQVFWDAIDIIPLDVAKKLHTASPDVARMRAIIGAVLIRFRHTDAK